MVENEWLDLVKDPSQQMRKALRTGSMQLVEVEQIEWFHGMSLHKNLNLNDKTRAVDIAIKKYLK
ncbi:MAG: hypothetical protein HQM14_00980 [SAR324 cluster bacterium]|nr:hypothetical protein [SAR324 cluster bacterium]